MAWGARWAGLLAVSLASGCAGQEQEKDASFGKVTLAVPAGWVAEQVDRGSVWSGPEGAPEHRTTIGLHVLPVRTDEVHRSPDAVARALAVQYRRMQGSTVRVRRAGRLLGRDAWEVETRFVRDGTRYRRRQLVCQRGDVIVHLDGTAPEAQWDDLVPILDRAIETTRWKG